MIDYSLKLPNKNFIEKEATKTQIVFGHTFNRDMRHYDGWLNRYNSIYKKTAHYTISSNGTIYEHFDPKFQSKYFKKQEQNLKSIVILIENDGWLIKDDKKNQFLTWIGDIYKEPAKIVEVKWRGFNYWSPYNEEQLESAVKLVNLLCDRFSIPMKTFNHNTKVDDLNEYKGVLYKSNLEKYYTDLSPSWDCKLFKTKIEKK